MWEEQAYFFLLPNASQGGVLALGGIIFLQLPMSFDFSQMNTCYPNY